MTIHILDINDLSVIGRVHNYTSFSLTLNYSKIGDFVLSIDNRIDNAKLFVKNRIVMLEDNGFNTGVVTNVSIEVDEDGYETRTIKGKTLGHLLSWRVVNSNGTNEYSFATGNAETVMKQYVDLNAVSATDEKRNFDNMLIAQDFERGSGMKWQSKMDKLSEVVTEIAELEELGWNVEIDLERNCLLFDIYEGRDLSGEVVFSTEYGNLSSQSYTYDEYMDKNFAYVAGEIFDTEVKLDEEGNIITETEVVINATTGEEMTIEKPKERRIYQVGNLDAQGFERKEAFIEVNESKDEYIDIPELGKRELESMTDLEAIEVKIIDNTIFQFGVDYNLGDIVSVYNSEWGIAKNLRINSMTIEIDENKDFEIYLTFGSVLPVFSDRVKQELKVIKPYTKK